MTLPRRDFVWLAAALAASTALPLRGAEGLRVVVAGAGIIGASVAYHLAKAGARVTVIDQTGPASHASRGTFAWINATWAKQPRSYHRFNQESVADWHDLQRDLKIPVSWGGSLEWFTGTERQRKLADQVSEQVRWGEPAQMVGAQRVAALEPELVFPGDGLAAHSPNDGAVDPVLATWKFLEAARAKGATLIYPSRLQGLEFQGQRLVAVETTTGALKADRLVLATGAAPDLPLRMAGIDIPQRTTSGVIAITKPMPRLLNGVVAAPGVHLHQRSDGRFVIGEQDGPPQTHEERLADRPNEFPVSALAQEHGARLLSAALAVLPALADTAVEQVFIGWRPLPLDGHPVLGVNPGRRDVYLAIMHSGVSLAPLVGELATRELLGDTVARLEAFRPTREFANIKRY